MAIVIPSARNQGVSIEASNFSSWFNATSVCAGVLQFYSDDAAGQNRRANITDGTRVYDNACGTNTFGSYMIRNVFGQQSIDIWAMRAAGLWTTSIQFTHSIVLRKNVSFTGGWYQYATRIVTRDASAQLSIIYDENVTGIGSTPACATPFTNSYSVTVYADGSYSVP